MAAIRGQAEVDPGRVGLFGASQAGWIAPRAAVDSGHVAFVALAAPGVVTFGQEHAYEELTGGYESDKPFPTKDEIAERLDEAGPSGFDIVPYLRRMDVPALWKKNCASCHGEDGKAQTKAGKSKKVQDLTNPDVRAKFDRARMIKSTKDGMKSEDGKELMKPYGEKLSDAEIAALTDYILNTLK